MASIIVRMKNKDVSLTSTNHAHAGTYSVNSVL